MEVNELLGHDYLIYNEIEAEEDESSRNVFQTDFYDDKTDSLDDDNRRGRCDAEIPYNYYDTIDVYPVNNQDNAEAVEKKKDVINEDMNTKSTHDNTDLKEEETNEFLTHDLLDERTEFTIESDASNNSNNDMELERKVEVLPYGDEIEKQRTVGVEIEKQRKVFIIQKIKRREQIAHKKNEEVKVKTAEKREKKRKEEVSQNGKEEERDQEEDGGVQRYDEALKNIKACAFKPEIQTIKNEESQNPLFPFLEILIKQFREQFVVEAKKGVNYKCLSYSILKLFVYSVDSLENKICKLETDIYFSTDNEKKVKWQLKLQELKDDYEMISTNLDLNNIAVNFRSDITKRILTKTFQMVISEYCESMAAKDNRIKLSKKKNKIYLDQYDSMIQNFEQYICPGKIKFEFIGRKRKNEQK